MRCPTPVLAAAAAAALAAPGAGCFLSPLRVSDRCQKQMSACLERCPGPRPAPPPPTGNLDERSACERACAESCRE